MRVQEIMTTDVLTIGPEAEIRDVARLFVERGISGLPVCDAQRDVLGVVSEGDILFKEQGPSLSDMSVFSRIGGKANENAEKALAVKVQEAMSSPAITVSPYNSVADAAKLMSEHGVNRLPVVREGELVGIVTRTDLVRAFVRSDEEILHEINEDLLRKTFWLASAVRVDVDRGAVRLEGHLETNSDAALLVRLVARVPGVVSVASDLSWTIDDASRGARRELQRTQELALKS